jgi:hypothetical protein
MKVKNNYKVVLEKTLLLLLNFPFLVTRQPLPHRYYALCCCFVFQLQSSKSPLFSLFLLAFPNDCSCTGPVFRKTLPFTAVTTCIKGDHLRASEVPWCPVTALDKREDLGSYWANWHDPLVWSEQPNNVIRATLAHTTLIFPDTHKQFPCTAVWHNPADEGR